MDQPGRQRLRSASNRAVLRFVRVLLRAQVGALLLGAGAGLLTLLWAADAPSESDVTDVAAVAAPEQSVETVGEVSWADERWELAPLRAALTEPPESGDGSGDGSDDGTDSIPHPLVQAAENLRDDGWDITGFANGDDGQYVEASTDERIVRVYAAAVVLMRAVPEGTGLAEQIGLGLGALIGGVTALRVGGPIRAPARPAANAARVAVACALLLPTGFAIHAGITGQPIAGWLGMRLTTLGLIAGLVLVLGLAAIAAVALVAGPRWRRVHGEGGNDGTDGSNGSSRGPTPYAGPDPW